MTPEQLFRDGRLADAVAAQTAEVKSKPADANRRLFLFELLVFAGEMDRAGKQLNLLSYEDPILETAKISYKECLSSEEKRRRVFAEGIEPSFLTEPPEHVRLRVQALAALRGNDAVTAGELLAQAQTLTPARSGTIEARQFQSIRDGDDLLSGVVEVYARGDYYWLAWEQIESLNCKPPKYPRDLIWRGCRLELHESSGEVFLPTRYFTLPDEADDSLRLGRATDWKELDGGLCLGMGLKELFTDDEPVPFLSWEEILFDVAHGESDSDESAEVDGDTEGGEGGE